MDSQIVQPSSSILQRLFHSCWKTTTLPLRYGQPDCQTKVNNHSLEIQLFLSRQQSLQESYFKRFISSYLNRHQVHPQPSRDDSFGIDRLSFNSVISLFDATACKWLPFQHQQPKNITHRFRKPAPIPSLAGEIKMCWKNLLKRNSLGISHMVLRVVLRVKKQNFQNL